MKFILFLLLLTAVGSKTHAQTVNVPGVAENDLFYLNKGKLSCPVQGKITMHFGHSDCYGVKFNNQFLTFQTDSVNAQVHAVFEGTIKWASKDDEGLFSIVIAHGNICSVYGNLSSVNVTVGQSVATGAIIGQTAKGYDTDKGEMEFGLLENKKLVDPQPWLGCR